MCRVPTGGQATPEQLALFIRLGSSTVFEHRLFSLQGASWGAQATPEQLALLRGDVDALSAWLGGTFDEELTAALAFLPPEVDTLLFTEGSRARSQPGHTLPAGFGSSFPRDAVRLAERRLQCGDDSGAGLPATSGGTLALRASCFPQALPRARDGQKPKTTAVSHASSRLQELQAAPAGRLCECLSAICARDCCGALCLLADFKCVKQPAE